MSHPSADDAQDFRFLSNEEIDNLDPEDPGKTLDWSEPADIFTSIPKASGDIPSGLMPASIEAYAIDQAAVVGMNAGPIMMSLVGAVAQAVPSKVRIRPKKRDPRWVESAIAFIGVTGPSGVAKSFAVDHGKKPYLHRDQQAQQAYKKAMAEYYEELETHKEELADWKRERKALRKKGEDLEEAGPRPKAPKEPTLEQNWVHDITGERLVEVCAHNPNGVIQVEDELARMLGAMGAYTGTAGRDQAIYNQAFGGGPYAVERMSRKVFAERVAVTLVGAITDSALSDAFAGKPRDGFIARFLFARAEARPDSGGTVDLDLWKRVQKTIDAVVEMDTKSTGFYFELDDEADKIRDNLRNWRIAVQKLDTTGPLLSEHLAKWDTYFARLCLIFQAYENAEKGLDQFEHRIVGADVARRVESLLKSYVLPEAVRMFTEVLGETGSKASPHTGWIANWILAGNRSKISVRDITHDYPKIAKEETRVFQAAMEQLEVAGWIERRETKRMRTMGEWAKTKWDVNPVVHERFATRAEAERQRREAVKQQIRDGLAAVKELGE